MSISSSPIDDCLAKKFPKAKAAEPITVPAIAATSQMTVRACDECVRFAIVDIKIHHSVAII
jgi:hypothetical protein